MTILVAGGNTISWNIVNKNVSSGASLKQKLARKVAVLAKHLIHFPPETLHLQVVLEKVVNKEVYNVSLALRIPSNILQAEMSSHDLFEAIDSAAAALLREVNSLKANLRGESHWKRPAYRARLRADEALFFRSHWRQVHRRMRTWFQSFSVFIITNCSPTCGAKCESRNWLATCRAVWWTRETS